ncbi:DUF1707 SHOCT-like domain-containing protein [Streptomyces sp. NRRL WC-3742]|uniref:DUF1707 SHOCT-like domain-containing protein n=1 Tax=Streptomyces sp. NRRL WC-3742 TaxID=1463934 RepID=UPI0004C791F0|nr:DUF1707 domain-containing protein [Streptomyces sp. NRRL WC-3742]
MSDERLPAVRAGDADREAVADRLRIAAGEGRIELAELDERLELAFAARTYRELDELVADLGPRAAGSLAADEVMVLQPTITNIVRKGRWTVPRRIVAECRMNQVILDFTEAHCPHGEVTVEATCRGGRVRLILPRSWALRIDPTSTDTHHILNRATTAEPAPGAPLITLIGHPGIGRIKIKQPTKG